MNGFEVTYASGLVERTLSSDCETIDAFVNSHFGSVDPKEHGAKIKLLSEKEVDEHLRYLQVESKVAAEEATPSETLTQMSAEMWSGLPMGSAMRRSTARPTAWGNSSARTRLPPDAGNSRVAASTTLRVSAQPSPAFVRTGP